MLNPSHLIDSSGQHIEPIASKEIHRTRHAKAQRARAVMRLRAFLGLPLRWLVNHKPSRRGSLLGQKNDAVVFFNAKLDIMAAGPKCGC